MCRRANHTSKLSLVTVGSECVSEPLQPSAEVAASLSLARTLFMERRGAYGPTIQISKAGSQLPTFEVCITHSDHKEFMTPTNEYLDSSVLVRSNTYKFSTDIIVLHSRQASPVQWNQI